MFEKLKVEVDATTQQQEISATKQRSEVVRLDTQAVKLNAVLDDDLQGSPARGVSKKRLQVRGFYDYGI